MEHALFDIQIAAEAEEGRTCQLETRFQLVSFSIIPTLFICKTDRKLTLLQGGPACKTRQPPENPPLKASTYVWAPTPQDWEMSPRAMFDTRQTL